MATATHLYTPEEITRLVEQSETRIGRNEDMACMFAQVASAKALAEIAYQLERLHELLNHGCIVVRKAEM